MKTKSPVAPGETCVDLNAQVIDENLSDEVFELLWGHGRNAIPTAVDYAYEQTWKQLVFFNQRKEQRLSDVALAEKLGVSRTPVRQPLGLLVHDGLLRSDPRRGFWLHLFTAHDIHATYEFR